MANSCHPMPVLLPRPSRSFPITCLGLTFDDDQARRHYFLGQLRESIEELQQKLTGIPFTTTAATVTLLQTIKSWPWGEEAQLWKWAEQMQLFDKSKDLWQRWQAVVGFPTGNLADILKLSDPPYYTAGPNPFFPAIIKHYGTPYQPASDTYQRVSFATAVSEGRDDPWYKVHSYHTKVPPQAIMRYILHYTQPGDLVFDGFAGSGMTGVAAQLCGERAAVTALWYQVDSAGNVLQLEEDAYGKNRWYPFSKLGTRQAILNELSPAATFIAYHYNTMVETTQLEASATQILYTAEKRWGWMYQTVHAVSAETPAASKMTTEEILKVLQGQLPKPAWLVLGLVNYTVWSDVFVCPHCTTEIIFWEVAMDQAVGKLKDKFTCPHCQTGLTKRELDRAWSTQFESNLSPMRPQAKKIPVLINYSIYQQRYEKSPDAIDLALLTRIEHIEPMHRPPEVPTHTIPAGDNTSALEQLGITQVHHFYTPRNLLTLGTLFSLSAGTECQWLVTGILPRASKQHQFAVSKLKEDNRGGIAAGPRPGMLYLPSLHLETNPLKLFAERLKLVMQAVQTQPLRSSPLPSPLPSPFSLATSSSVILSLPSNSLDYIFTDPPLGGNLLYSELNFLWESWLRVFTQRTTEVVISKTQGKSLTEYQQLLGQCFQECYRVLKPGRWMSVVFHHSQHALWSAVQTTLQQAGFVIATVQTLDKQMKTPTQRRSPGAVSQDLVISSYKMPMRLEESFKLIANTTSGCWEFIKFHLTQLPVAVLRQGIIEVQEERLNYSLFDRLVAFYLHRGATVPLTATEFYHALTQQLVERDQMYFLPEQIAEYDHKRLLAKAVVRPAIRVTDEVTAIRWLRQQLTLTPQTFQDLHPQFVKQLSGWQAHEKLLELTELLAQNFLCYEGQGPVPAPIYHYLSSQVTTLRYSQDQDADLIVQAKGRWYIPDLQSASELEQLREKILLKEFWQYLSPIPSSSATNAAVKCTTISPQPKILRLCRLEAIRAGFKYCWQHQEVKTIIAIAQRLPETILQEDVRLLIWYNNALSRDHN